MPSDDGGKSAGAPPTTGAGARIEVLSDEALAEGGFLRLRRMRLRNLRDDGSYSEPYLCDFAERPRGLDAVAVVLYARGGDGVRVLLRDALRPPLLYGRPDGRSPWLAEIVAGLIEPGDEGEDGLRRRAAREALEEAGLRVAPEAIRLLGAPVYPTPGVIPERIWFAAAEVDPASAVAPGGDGSPMEEDARVRWMALDEALAAARDGKTEIGLRRLAQDLAAEVTSDSATGP